MPSADILVESKITPSFRVEQVRGMFDVPKTDKISHRWSVNLPIESRDWQIGLIVGHSGSGKTTIAKKLFSNARYHSGYHWLDCVSVVDCFPENLSGADITQALSSVGFSSPPHWLKPYSHLSNGQKFRCELARLMLENDEIVIFDEFTSVVDRDAAKISCSAVAKSLRQRKKPKLIAVTCHFDVIDWLNPDWVYNVSTNDFQWRLLRQRPKIELRIYKTTIESWKLFRGHHYLTGEISKAARCFIATWNDKPVAFTSYIHLVHPRLKNTKREHRTVVLPDYQGAGIGNAVSEWLGEYLKKSGYKFQSTTSHPAMIRHRHKSKLWKVKRIGRVAPSGNNSTVSPYSVGRVTANCVYLGENNEESR